MGAVETGDLPTAVGAELEVAVDDRRVVARPGQPILIGRDPACQLHVDTPVVSRRHAEVAWTEHGWGLRDLGSSNGTYLDGKRGEVVPVVREVRVRLGRAADRPLLRLRRSVDARTPQHSPAAPPAP